MQRRESSSTSTLRSIFPNRHLLAVWPIDDRDDTGALPPQQAWNRGLGLPTRLIPAQENHSWNASLSEKREPNVGTETPERWVGVTGSPGFTIYEDRRKPTSEGITLHGPKNNIKENASRRMFLRIAGDWVFWLSVARPF